MKPQHRNCYATTAYWITNVPSCSSLLNKQSNFWFWKIIDKHDDNVDDGESLLHDGMPTKAIINHHES